MSILCTALMGMLLIRRSCTPQLGLVAVAATTVVVFVDYVSMT